MAVIGKDTKQPEEVLDWDVDFGDWMRPGDALYQITTSVRILAGDITSPLVVDKTEITTTVVKVWVSGGADGARYRVEVQAETIDGRIKEAEFDITVKEV